MPGATNTPSPWFNCLHARPEAKSRLICFPWCGGGSQLFARWGADFGKNIEVVGIRLPGRETRGKEAFVPDLKQLVKQMAEEILKHYNDKPFAFFGHSLGTVLSYETAVYLKVYYGVEPRHMFFSSEHAPHSKVNKERLKEKPLYQWTDEDLLDRIAEHGGTPKTFLENKEFMTQTFLPPYRADIKLVAKYFCDLKGKRPLSCNITVTDGEKDEEHNLADFKELTSGKFQQHVYPGGHFYLLKDENARKMKEHMKRTITAW